ncbi:GspH/FimT family pseudopilin [Marinobacterium rhizophilum]|uniref:Type II secretion system protein H n=1 Tax=Marinobacterium rhizophilum TaxID=420402 RepID=A0ABY5HJV8_9GAMM|nr:GspH/FimT family pseudopilin [Marinobacterium rhizophilum]UTW11241.1 GspH/FimT family pseudopilin [Marinobacterium rhizophilum]
MYPFHATCDRLRQNRTAGGFTLIELLVTLSIAAILLTIGVPSFSYVLEDSRMDRGQSSLVDAIQFAQSEAVKRNAVVTVAPVSGGDWANGLSVMLSAEQLRRLEGLTGVSLSCVGACTTLSFSGAGTSTAQTFRLCSTRGSSGREMTLYATGKVKSASWGGCGA